MTLLTRRALALYICALALPGCDGQSVQGGDGRIYVGGGQFGQSVALDGDRMLVGATETDQAFVLGHGADGWRLQATLSQPAGTPSEVLFGWSADIEGNVAVVGGPAFGEYSGSFENRLTSGRAYIFEQSGGTWNRTAELSLPESQDAKVRRSFFGLPVAVSGGRVAIASRGTSVILDAQVVEPAAVLIYERGGGGWTETARIEEVDFTPLNRTEGFGAGMDLDGDRLAAASSARDVGGAVDAGSVHVYQRAGRQWSRVATLSAPSPRANDRLGDPLSLSGSLLAVSAVNRANAAGGLVGSALVFRETAGVWAFEAELQPADLAGLDSYGFAIAADSSPSGDRVAVSAAGRDQSRGAVFVWVRRPSGAWEFEAELQPEGYGRGTAFGEGVALEGDRLVAGAIYADGTRGGVFEFRRGPGGWEQVFD